MANDRAGCLCYCLIIVFIPVNWGNLPRQSLASLCLFNTTKLFSCSLDWNHYMWFSFFFFFVFPDTIVNRKHKKQVCLRLLNVQGGPKNTSSKRKSSAVSICRFTRSLLVWFLECKTDNQPLRTSPSNKPLIISLSRYRSVF